jgi:hypothetical protein
MGVVSQRLSMLYLGPLNVIKSKATGLATEQDVNPITTGVATDVLMPLGSVVGFERNNRARIPPPKFGEYEKPTNGAKLLPS